MRTNGVVFESTDLAGEIVELRREIDDRTRCYLRALARFDAESGWAAEGCQSAVAWLRSRTRVAAGVAYSDVALARRLYGSADNGLPLVAAAVESGAITLDHARAVARETSSLAPALLAQVEPIATAAAERLEAGQLGNVCAQARRTVIAEQERRDRAAEALAVGAAGVEELAGAQAAALIADEHRSAELGSRYFRRIDHGRMVSFEGMLPRVDAEAFWSVVTALSKPKSQPTRPDAGGAGLIDSRTAVQRYADAVGEIAKRFLSPAGAAGSLGPIGQVQVIVDLDDLLGRAEQSSARLPSGRALGRDELERVCCDAAVSVTVGTRLPRPRGATDRDVPGPSRLGQAAEAPGLSGLGQFDHTLLDRALTVISPALGGAGFEVLAQGRSKRVVTAGQRRALRARDRGCVMPGCDRPPEWCEAHHLTPWSEGGKTDLNGLALLCSRDHHLLHQKGWSLKSDGHGGFVVDKGEP